MRTPFIAGNWKMNLTLKESVALVEELKDLVSGVTGVEIAVCPPAVNLTRVQEVLKDTSIKVGAQNMHWEDSGAFTGELSPVMLRDIDVDYIIIGHSERRQYFNETDQIVNRKVQAAHTHGLKPIICVGESLDEREEGKTRQVVKAQVKSALAGLTKDQVADSVIAYEPIWAIGTGKSATAEEANDVIKFIRETVNQDFDGAGDAMRIQYGGSVKPHNIEDFIKQSDIDGALVGGASLKAESFAEIVKKSV
ncbi:triose-phosphate isomerase [Halothermothrix orenii]|uniref:Triosephosphate isomerase n=1 Tax=Halothermothrix orenii (strain H 168 / OCM 544 / DSM 9562) TaxID=373903 RepID=B8CYG1_HALOH|nr:triose-phosphate isomerase [Halothermothrix orenii]ACL70330.1 Triose-phosphate isomerase [Halothermothrix orenii H 168]